MEKLCKDCGLSKPVEEFYQAKNRADGLSFYCKACTRERTKDNTKKPPRHQSAEGMNFCQCCKTEKPIAEFYNSTRTFTGLSKRCKACSFAEHEKWRLKNLPKVAAQGRKWRAENRDRAKDHFLKMHYGLPLGSYAKMLVEQEGKCAICRTETPGGKGRFHVDHDHETGVVRGLLCGNCNVGIGHFRHNREFLWSAIEYLDRYP